jgi:phosphopantothenoylcysteine decarboxylase/phosphopantothenate--cysteine ligase
MRETVLLQLLNYDAVIMAAAPADYMLEQPFLQKVKTDTLTLNLKKTPDIAADVGRVKGDKKLIIFAAETENCEQNAKQKLLAKNADMVVLNDVSKEGAGFFADTNIVTIITKNGTVQALPKMSKVDCANKILDAVAKL